MDSPQVSHVSSLHELGNKPGFGEGGLVVDVVVWTECEEREKWWREIVGIAPSGYHCVASDVGELPRAKLSAASTRSESLPAALRDVTAA